MRVERKCVFHARKTRRSGKIGRFSSSAEAWRHVERRVEEVCEGEAGIRDQDFVRLKRAVA
jgi:hypothetical protein